MAALVGQHIIHFPVAALGQAGNVPGKQFIRLWDGRLFPGLYIIVGCAAHAGACQHNQHKDQYEALSPPYSLLAAPFFPASSPASCHLMPPMVFIVIEEVADQYKAQSSDNPY